MGQHKKMHQEIMEAFPDIWRSEVEEIKKHYPHIKTEAAKILALDAAIPQFMMLAMNIDRKYQQESTKKETKNVKRRPAKKETKQSNGKQGEGFPGLT